MGGFGLWEILILLLIVVLLFGTARLRKAGWDFGEAFTSLKSAVGLKPSSNPATENAEEEPLVLPSSGKTSKD